MRKGEEMQMTALRQMLGQEKVLYTGWCNMGNALLAEMIARSALGAVVTDMQHGGIGFEQARQMTSAVTMVGKPSILRIPVGDFSTASRALDFGCLGIIAPMINSAEDAREFVAAVKYPPVGQRSYGPARAYELFGLGSGNDYVASGNEACLAFAMVETMQALDNLDAILAVEGIDGIFMGPADLSLTLLQGEKVDLDNEAANVIYRDVATRVRAAGKVAGIYAATTDYAKRFADYGYQMISVASDAAYFRSGLAQIEGDLAL